jgi:hypothetical protein
MAGRQRPYLTDATMEDLEAHESKRLSSHLAHRPVGTLSEQDIGKWMAAHSCLALRPQGGVPIAASHPET